MLMLNSFKELLISNADSFYSNTVNASSFFYIPFNFQNLS